MQKQGVPNQCDFTSGSGLRSTAINVSVCLSVRSTTCPNIITFSERCRRLTSFKFKSLKIDIEVRFSRLSIMSPQRKQDFWKGAILTVSLLVGKLPGLPWIWDGDGDRNSVPTAALEIVVGVMDLRGMLAAYSTDASRLHRLIILADRMCSC